MWWVVVAWITVGLTALNAGVFFAFSSFVVPGLRRMPPLDAARAMRAINRQVPRSLYLPVFLLSPLGGVIVALTAVIIGKPIWLVIGGALAFAAALVSFVVNIPRNDALERADDADAAAWGVFVGPWAAANHVRTLVATTGAVLLVIGLLAT